MLEDGEEAVEEDLQSDGGRVRSVEEQAGDVEDDVRLDDLGRDAQLVHRPVAELVEGCKAQRGTLSRGHRGTLS